jgi:hypothetical protein
MNPFERRKLEKSKKPVVNNDIPKTSLTDVVSKVGGFVS